MVGTLETLSLLKRSSKKQLGGLNPHRWVEMAEVTMLGTGRDTIHPERTEKGKDAHADNSGES